MPVVSEERFQSGQTYEQVRDRVNADGGRSKELLAIGEDAAKNADIDITAFNELRSPVNVLVLSEEWCPDCTDGLPIINRIAKESGKLNVRIFPRDQNLDLADQFLNKGEFRSIPTVIFLDDNYDVIGFVSERPDSVTDYRKQKRQALHEAHPELGGFDARPDELSDDVREARLKAEAAVKAESYAFSVPEIAKWLSTPIQSVAVS
jgi:thiol-disulfide isomerase/thioredoxin